MGTAIRHPQDMRWSMERKESLQAEKKNLTMWTKYLLDFMFYAGIGDRKSVV